MITAQIVGADQALGRLGALPNAVNSAVTRAIGNLGRELQQRVQDKLSGEVLQARSGRLRSSMDLEIDTDPPSFTATISTDLDYGRANELGFGGMFAARAGRRNIRKAIGHPITEKSFDLRVYQRRFDLPANPFLVSALDDMTPDVGAEIDAALHEALAP